MTDVQSAQAPEPVAPENFPLAIVAGLAVAIVGAVAWAAITVATEFRIGIMAVALGYAIGYAIKAVGHGHSQKFGIAGAACALFGCVLGNLFSAVMFYAQQTHLPVMDVLSAATPGFLLTLMQAFSQAMDLVFYGIAVYEGYRFSFRH